MSSVVAYPTLGKDGRLSEITVSHYNRDTGKMEPIETLTIEQAEHLHRRLTQSINYVNRNRGGVNGPQENQSRPANSEGTPI